MRRKIPIEDHNNPVSPELDAQAAASGVDNGAAAPAAEDAPAIVPEQEIVALREIVDRLEKQVVAERASAEDARNQYLRTLADFQNFRRRSEEQKGEISQIAIREFVIGLLPVIDNFERALASAEKTQSYEAVVGGLGLIMRQIQDYLKKNGIEPIEAVGQEFDPNFHEAVMRVDDGEHPENTVVDELQRGYTMNSRVLRPSMVKVARS